MEYQPRQDRWQLTLYTTCLDDMVSQENTVRAIDNFVNSLDLAELGFKTLASQGRPPYDPADLLKLYLYGYMNRMDSSRVLELECARNIELIWLLKNLKPDHNTIARFRKDNPKAIKRVFRATVSIAKNHDLIGATLLAGDSTKLRAQNSKKNNYNKKKVAPPSRVHRQKTGPTRKGTRQGRWGSLPDDKHKLLVDGKLTNENDKKAMGMMLRRSKSILASNDFTALFDKGYHTGNEFKIAHDLGVATLVAIPEIGRASQAPDPSYNAEYFDYDANSDSYTCPQGHFDLQWQLVHRQKLPF